MPPYPLVTDNELAHPFCLPFLLTAPFRQPTSLDIFPPTLCLKHHQCLQGEERKMAAFTAMNGDSSPKAAVDSTANGGSVDRNRMGSAERTNGSALPADQHPKSQQQQQQPPPPPKESSPTKGERESWAVGSHASDRPVHSPATYQEAENSHKRKRSDESMDEPRRHTDEARLDSEHRPYADGPRDRWYSPHEDRDERHPYSQPASAIPDSAHSDEQMETLRRATEDYPQTSPDGEDRPVGYYTSEHHRSGVISDPKKRKRNFSNRTKTGCLTCRKRKKKCDEAKPECKC